MNFMSDMFNWIYWGGGGREVHEKFKGGGGHKPEVFRNVCFRVREQVSHPYKIRSEYCCTQLVVPLSYPQANTRVSDASVVNTAMLMRLVVPPARQTGT
jgi:hypothetical protein